MNKQRDEVGSVAIRLAAAVLLWLGVTMAVLLVKSIIALNWVGISQTLLTIFVCVMLLRLIHKTIKVVEGQDARWLP